MKTVGIIIIKFYNFSISYNIEIVVDSIKPQLWSNKENGEILYNITVCMLILDTVIH